MQKTVSVALCGGVAAFALALCIHGSTKRSAKIAAQTAATAEVTDDDIARGWRLVSVATNAAIRYDRPRHGTRYRNWWLRGGYEDRFWLDPGGFRFPLGTNEWSRFSVSAWGEIRPVLRDRSRTIVATGCPMSAVPQRSEFWWSAEPDGSRVLTWRNFALNRDTDTPVNAQIVLFPSGDFVTRSNGVERAFVRVEPFDWDGDGIPNGDDANPRRHDGNRYGQTPERRAWVAAQVGHGRNGLYRLRATFPADPPRRTLLTVGTNRVIIVAAGDYDFLLEKGEEYSISTEPFVAAVRYSADDGNGGVSAQSAASTAVGQWTEDFGRLHILPQTASGAGAVCWLPGLRGSPDAGHVGTFPGRLRFAANFTDCRTEPAASYRWRTDDPDVRILSPNAKVTEVEFATVPSWRSSEIAVTATVGTNALTSVLRFTYGLNATPQVRLSLALPQGMVRRDLWMAGSRAAPLAVRLGADCPTGGTVRVWQESGAEFVELDRPLPAGFAVTDAAEWSETVEVTGIAKSAAEGDVRFACSFTPPGAAEPSLRAEARGTVYAPGAVAVPEAPATGLAVVRGASVGVEVGMSPAAGRGVSVEWRTARRRTRDGYDPWQLRTAGGAAASLAMDGAGVFALRARTVCATQSNEVEYVHLEDEPFVKAIREEQGPNKKGERNHIGVASTAGLLAIRNAALGHLNKAEYVVDKLLWGRNGFSAVPSAKWKCNAFVADMAIAAGFKVPALHVVEHEEWWKPTTRFPPTANEWALGRPEVEGWIHLGRDVYPEPGFISARPDPFGMGHVGIVDYDGWTISARDYGVSRLAKRMLDGTCGYNKPKEEIKDE